LGWYQVGRLAAARRTTTIVKLVNDGLGTSSEGSGPVVVVPAVMVVVGGLDRVIMADFNITPI
jgi:hypothetical protein